MGNKFCPNCKIIKPKNEFYGVPKRYDGCAVYCKDCTSKKSSKKYASILVKIVCDICGKEFIGTQNKLKCSRECRGRKMRKAITGYKDCEFCKNKIPYRDSLKQRSCGSVASIKTRFCSNQCKMNWLIKIHLPTKLTNEKRKILSDRAKITFTGRKLTTKERRKKSLAKKGANSYFWEGGKTSKSKIIRASLDYRLWREAVFKRDDFTCLWCGVRGGRLHADHIKPFAFYPELRFDLGNGRTLCIDCHKKTDTYLKNKYTTHSIYA